MPVPDKSVALQLRGLHAGYGATQVLRGVDLQVQAGEIVSLLGRNGSGRSTLLKAVMGLVAPTAGDVFLAGRNVSGLPPHRVSRLGVAYVPEGRELFGSLTVEQNLQLGKQPRRDGCFEWTAERLLDYFPRLRERRHTRAGNLSGGEQQMLALCRSLLGQPRVLLLDEPTEGLAPAVVTAVQAAIEEIAAAGVAVLLVEQKLAIALEVAARVYVMGHGRVVFEGTADEFQSREAIAQAWLAV